MQLWKFPYPGDWHSAGPPNLPDHPFSRPSHCLLSPSPAPTTIENFQQKSSSPALWDTTLLALGLPSGSSDGEESACHAGRPGFDPWVGKIPSVGKILWRREWQPTPVFLPGEFHGQRRLVDYSPWDHKELDSTGQLTLSRLPSSSLLLGIHPAAHKGKESRLRSVHWSLLINYQQQEKQLCSPFVHHLWQLLPLP